MAAISMTTENTPAVSRSASVGSQDAAMNSGSLFAAVRAKVEEKRRSAEASVLSDNVVDQEMEAFLLDVNTLDSSSAMDIEPFSFWEKRKEKLPKIYDIAVDILSIPATSAPTERVFSRASFVLKRNRHNLCDAKLEAEVFFKFNMEFLA